MLPLIYGTSVNTNTKDGVEVYHDLKLSILF